MSGRRKPARVENQGIVQENNAKGVKSQCHQAYLQIERTFPELRQLYRSRDYIIMLMSHTMKTGGYTYYDPMNISDPETTITDA